MTVLIAGLGKWIATNANEGQYMGVNTHLVVRKRVFSMFSKVTPNIQVQKHGRVEQCACGGAQPVKTTV